MNTVLRSLLYGTLFGALSISLSLYFGSSDLIFNYAVPIGLTIVACILASSASSSQLPKTKQSKSSGSREEGVVKWFNVSKGFGFITRNKGGDIFVHYRFIRGRNRRSLKEGERVAFLVGKGEKGLQAEDVEVRVSSSRRYR